MSHFAKINNDSTVVQTIVAEQDFINSGAIGDSFRWVQTSYNDNFRKNYAGVGFTYDRAMDAFIAPKPYPSWSLDETTCRWVAPISYPADAVNGKGYAWDEDTLSWLDVAVLI
jgi:hypothetical protein